MFQQKKKKTMILDNNDFIMYSNIVLTRPLTKLSYHVR